MLAELDLKALFESQEALSLFLAFFIPGFIAKKVYGLFVPTGEQDFGKQLPEVVAYSAIHYAVLGWILLIPAPPWLSQSAWQSFLGYLLVLGIPLIEAPIILRFRDPEGFREVLLPWKTLGLMQNPKPTPWDIQFTGELAKRVRIRLKNDKWVGGELGDDSCASTYPNPEQLFISRAYYFDDDGDCIDQGQPSVGLLVNGTEISHIEITTIQKTPIQKPPEPTEGSQPS